MYLNILCISIKKILLTQIISIAPVKRLNFKKCEPFILMGNHCGGHVAGTKFHVEKETASRLVKLPFRKTPFRKRSQIRVAKASQNEQSEEKDCDLEKQATF